MVADIKKSIATGSVYAPPSKSMAHRLLICAALTGSECKIENVSLSEDISATIDCLNSLGAVITVENDTAFVKGIDFNNLPDEIILNCRESGSTLRFMIPILLLTGKKSVLRGSNYLFTRPLSVYEEICTSNGFLYEKGVNSLVIKGRLSGGNFTVNGDISSQFISGLLFVLPFLEHDSKIIINGNFESRSYVEMTLKVLSLFGVEALLNDNVIFVKASQKYVSTDAFVEGDYSNSAFLDALNYVGGNVSVLGLNEESLQGDKVYIEYFEELSNGTPTLDISNCPDLAPILFALAAYLNGATFVGTRRLKMKESDRASVMKEELEKFGSEITVLENKVVIEKRKLNAPNTVLCGHNDHRIVMALSVLLTVFSGKIKGAEAIKKSFPDFFEKISTLGVEVSLYDN